MEIKSNVFSDASNQVKPSRGSLKGGPNLQQAQQTPTSSDIYNLIY